jgi:hypothetical protein
MGELVSSERVSAGEQFDYNSVPAPTANFLKRQAYLIRRQLTKVTVEIGRALIEAKRHLSHGAFICWVEYEVGIPARSAQGYMRVALWSSNKCAAVTHLPPTILYLLSASTTPNEFAEEILKRVDQGESFRIADVRRELRARLDARAKPEGTSERSDDGRQIAQRGGDETVLGMVDNRDAVIHMIRTLYHGLSPAEFLFVKNIMTGEALLNDPDLRSYILTAFSHFPSRSNGAVVQLLSGT